MSELTPMMRQYLQIKADYPDTILFFRLGDFYEMFLDDAVKASRILDITLTSRNKNSEGAEVPLCGVPYHSATPYIAKLIESGEKVAICEQVEDPRTAKGIVRREVVKVITPGMVIDAESLSPKENNYLLSLFAAGGEAKAAGGGRQIVTDKGAAMAQGIQDEALIVGNDPVQGGAQEQMGIDGAKMLLVGEDDAADRPELCG